MHCYVNAWNRVETNPDKNKQYTHVRVSDIIPD